MTDDEQETTHQQLEEKRNAAMKYRLSVCTDIILLGEEGMHVEEMAYNLGVATSTIYEWEKLFPEFKSAFRLAKEASVAWWYRKGREEISNKSFQGKAWEFVLRSKLRVGHTDRAIVVQKLGDSKSFGDSRKALLEGLESGQFTTREFLELSTGLANLAKTEETHDLKAMLDDIKESMKLQK